MAAASGIISYAVNTPSQLVPFWLNISSMHNRIAAWEYGSGLFPPMVSLASVVRKTLPDDRAFLGRQCFVAENTIWWDLSYIHLALRQSGIYMLKPCRLYSDMQSIVGGNFRPPQGSDDFVHTAVATTTGLLLCYAKKMQHATSSKLTFHMTTFTELADRALETISQGDFSEINCNGSCCTVDKHGRLYGLPSLLGGRLHHQMMWYPLRKAWMEMRHANFLDGAFDADSHSLLDVLKFLLSAAWRCGGCGRHRDQSAMFAVEAILDSLLAWLSWHCDTYIRRVYTCSASADLPPPALLHKGRSGKKERCSVAPEAVWEIMQQARMHRASLEQAIDLKSDMQLFGCHSSNAATWINKELQLYSGNCEVALRHVNHYCLVADPGHHGFKDCLVSVGYSHELNTGSITALVPSPLWESNTAAGLAHWAATRTFREVEAITLPQPLDMYVHISTSIWPRPLESGLLFFGIQKCCY